MEELKTEHGIFTNNEITGQTAEQVYQDFLNGVKPQLSPSETLSKEVANLKISDTKKDAIITNALQTIASLKLEIVNLKGGN